MSSRPARSGWYEVRHHLDPAEKAVRWWFDAEEDRWRPSRWSIQIYHPRLGLLQWMRWRGLLAPL
jgi:hypothetical protein